MKRGAPIKRSGRLRPNGARSKRDGDARSVFRAHVLERANGRCERCGSGVRVHAHHTRRRSRAPGQHDPAFGRALCWICHASVHDHTAKDWRMWFSK